MKRTHFEWPDLLQDEGIGVGDQPQLQQALRLDALTARQQLQRNGVRQSARQLPTGPGAGPFDRRHDRLGKAAQGFDPDVQACARMRSS